MKRKLIEFLRKRILFARLLDVYYTRYDRKLVKISKGSKMYWCTFEGKNEIGSGVTSYNSTYGYGTYVREESYIFGAKIGRYCSIARDVRVIAGNHPTDYVATSPLCYEPTDNTVAEIKYVDRDKGIVIDVGSDVWIGEGARLLGGISIGDGAVIGAGALVTKNVPPYAVVGGVPAKVIKYRFSESDIEALMKIKWWDKSPEWINSHKNGFADIKTFIDMEENRID